MANTKTPMLNGGRQDQDQDAESTLAERIAGASSGWNRDGKSPTDYLREAAEADRKEQERKDAVTHQIERLVNQYVLKLLTERVAAQKAARKAQSAAARKAKVAQSRKAQSARTQAAMRYGEVAQLVIKALTDQGYDIKDAQNAVPVVVARLRKLGANL